MKFIIIFITTFLILIFGGGIEFIKTAINVYSPKNIVAKENNLIEINRMQEQEIKKLQNENEVLRSLARAIAKNHIETAELNRILMLTKNQGPVPINVNGNLLTCINTGITIECN